MSTIRMDRLRTVIFYPGFRMGLLLVASQILLLSVSCRRDIASLWADGRKSHLPDSGRVVARSGKLSLYADSVFFAAESLSVLSPQQISQLKSGARNLVLRSLIIRRLAIDEGMRQGIFGDREAAEYILPRVEKILEDYYYYRLTHLSTLTGEFDRLQNDEGALKEFLEKDPVIKSRKLSREQLRQELATIVDRLKHQKVDEAREAAKRKLITSNPPIEVLP